MANIVATRIKSLREQRGLDVAQVANMSGISGSHIYRIEAGDRPNVSGVVIGQLAKALDTTTDYLVGLTDDPNPRPNPASLSTVERVATDPRFQQLMKSWLILDDAAREVCLTVIGHMAEHAKEDDH